MFNKDEIRSAMQEMMNDVMNRGYDLLIHKPEQTQELDKLLTRAAENLSAQLGELEQIEHTSSEKEAEARYEGLSKQSQERSLELLAAIQRIERGQSNIDEFKYY